MTGRDNKGRFLPGRCETAEERLTRMRSVAASVKNRPGYIGDIKDVHPRIYGSWRAIRFTDKGKRAGCTPEWENFRCFYNDVAPTYTYGKVLRRLDTTKRWGQDNFVWVTTSEAAAMKSGIELEYNGEIHTLKEWAFLLNLPIGPIRVRYHNRDKKSFTAEEILFGRKVKTGSKIPKDAFDKGVNIRSKASKMISTYKVIDNKRQYVNRCNLTIDWLIENILTKPCTYCGDTKRIGCDRVDNNQGHAMDNVVPCCVECNAARNNFFSYDEMLVLGRVIADIKSKRK